MAMSVEQARAIVEREGAAVRLFVNYLNDPGIQFYFQVRIAATTDNRKERKILCKICRGTVRQLVVLEEVGWTTRAPALAMIVRVVCWLVEGPGHIEAIFPPALIPSQETVEAYLTLFHENMSYTQDSEGPQNAPADVTTTPWSYEES